MTHSASNRNIRATSPRCARLLIVDDDQSIRELHSRVLSMAGYEVATAEDGIVALERLAEEPFDLVLTDKQMPNLGGVSIVLALRSAGSRIPIVMVSGSLAQYALPPAIAREVFAALPKPAHIADVVSAVARALSAKREPERMLPRRNIQFLKA